MKGSPAIAFAVALLTGAASLGAADGETGLACPEDARQCPDGSSVGRDPGNNCEFAACPESMGCPRDLRVCPDGTKLSRDPARSCRFPACPKGSGTATGTSVHTESGIRTVTRTEVSTRTRTRVRTETQVHTSVSALTGTRQASAGQSQALCQAATLETMGTLIHLDHGKQEESFLSYARAREQASRAAGLNNRCEPEETGLDFLREEAASELARNFASSSGLPASAAAEHVHELATEAGKGELGELSAGLSRLLGKVPDPDKQLKLRSGLDGLTEERRRELLASEEQSTPAPPPPAAQRPAPVAPPGGPAALPQLPAVPREAAKGNPFAKIAAQDPLLSEESMEEERGQLRELSDPAGERDAPAPGPEASLFERVSARYRALASGMARPEIWFLDRERKGKTAR